MHRKHYLDFIDIHYLHHYVIILGHQSSPCKPNCSGKAKTDHKSYTGSLAHRVDTGLLESLQPALFHLLESFLSDTDSIDNEELDSLIVSNAPSGYVRRASRWYRLASRRQRLGGMDLYVRISRM